VKVLVVGAGAVGGYFGARLAEKGEDVTFLVREKRAHLLNEHGLQVKSIHGDYHFHAKTLLAGDKRETFDLILLSVKAYHLEKVVEELTPFAGDQTLIMPLLNGFALGNTAEEIFERACNRRFMFY
jgi:2-dehydropantoate 2-reductase